MQDKELWEKAKKAAESSYSPYSHFRVGAALLTEEGEIFSGTNVENRSFGLTICAERSAFASAISQGYRKFKKLHLICLDAEYPVPPCGACRQVISEFVDPDFPIWYMSGKGEIIKTSNSVLYPGDSLHELKE